MQAALLMGVYIATTAVMQFFGFLISRLIDHQLPTFGLMTFLVLFLAAFGLAWPIAVALTEWVLRRNGIVVDQLDKRAV